MQEFVSVAMSIANLAAHIRGILRVEGAVASCHAKYPFHHVWQMFALMHCIAWICSAIFHARDTLMTERADYVAAFSVVIVTCATAVIRIVSLRCVV
jgi:post-GPI attachment to proteins factor 3